MALGGDGGGGDRPELAAVGGGIDDDAGVVDELGAREGEAARRGDGGEGVLRLDRDAERVDRAHYETAEARDGAEERGGDNDRQRGDRGQDRCRAGGPPTHSAAHSAGRI
jgi:hypothetical protein